MIFTSKYCIMTALLAVGLLAIVVSAKPGVTTSKIRIHVPVKHHTHVHTLTKTIIKEVHVPAKKPHHETEEEPHHKPQKYYHPSKHHRVSDEQDNYDDSSEEYDDLYQKQKPKKFYAAHRPFY